MGLSELLTPRVVLITPKYPPVPSGYGNQAFTVNKRLMDRVSIWLATPGDAPLEIAKAHERASTEDHRVKSHRAVTIAEWIAKTSAWLIRNREQYDVIHVLGGYYWALPFIFIGNTLGKPTIVKITSRELEVTDDGTFRRRIRISFLRRATRLVVLSDYTRRVALQAGFRPDQIRIIPNGVDVERYLAVLGDRESIRRELGIKGDCFVVLFVGQIGRRKGVDRLVSVWREFRESALGPVRLILVGAPDGSVPLDNVLDADDVLLTGHVKEPDCYFGAADAFVLLSRSEGLANVLLEATAAGIPCIVSDIPANRELAERLGCLVARGSDREMIFETVKHLRSLERTFRTGSVHSRNERGQDVVRERYALEFVTEQYESFYRELLR